MTQNEKDIQRFEEAPWLLLFTFALAKDLVDPIPIITIIIDLFTAPYFLYFLLRYTKKEERVLGSVALCLEMIPFIGILPAETGSFLVIYGIMRKKRDEAKKRTPLLF